MTIMQKQFLKLLKLFGIGMGTGILFGLTLHGINKFMDYLKTEKHGESKEIQSKEM